MIRGRKVAAVARFEFFNVAGRLSYLLVTFGLPVLFSTLSGGLLAFQGAFLASRVERAVVYGLVDHHGVLSEEVIWKPYSEVPERAQRDLRSLELPIEERYRFLFLDSVLFAQYQDEEEALAQLDEGHLGAVYVLGEDYMDTGEVHVFEAAKGPVISVRGATVEPTLSRLLRDRMLRGRVDETRLQRVLSPLELERSVATDEGLVPAEDRVVELLMRAGVPFLLGVLLLTALLSSSGYLVQTVALDKESKVVEVLLSSANPDELLTGKLLGLGAAGLLQFLIWAAMVVGGGLAIATLVASMDIPIPWEALAASPIFFVMGYLFIGSLMLATGSLGSSVPESQKLTLGWALLAVLPLLTMIVLLEEPHGPIGRLLTWIPFSAPLTVVVRMSIEPEGIAFWEILGAFGVLLASTWLSIRFGARLFRVGLLLSGTRPRFREILKQARLLE
ncbi:MAG: ABC transporter permease [Myxococcota bacterium]